MPASGEFYENCDWCAASRTLNTWMAFRYAEDDEWYRPETPWGVCLDMNGWSPALRTGFATQLEAEQFIHDQIVTAVA
jgi:hypothetical protein